MQNRYIFFFVLRNVWFFTKFFILKSVSEKCDHVFNWQCTTNQWVFSQAVSFKVSLKETYLRIQLMYVWQLTMCDKSTKRYKTLVKKFVTYWFFECKSLCYPKTCSLPHHQNCQALEQLQRKDLATRKVLKLLKRSGSQCKYTAEYRFKIAKQPSLNKATSAATHFSGKVY